MATRLSPGWGTDVTLGQGQEAVLNRLHASVRHPSRSWHLAPPMRAYGRSAGCAWRTLQRLRELGLVALQTSFGCRGGTRFTFGVRRWLWRPPRRARLARMIAPGQLALAHSWAQPTREEASAALRAILERQPSAPTLQEPCALCGSLEPVRMGIYLDGGQAIAVRRCLDHEACEARRAHQ